MLYHSDKKLKLQARQFSFTMKIMAVILLILSAVLFSSCALLTEQLDNRTGFSKYLNQIEVNIRNEDWNQAKTSLEYAKKAWKKLKPLLQVDIDHDYVKDIEENFVKLDAYLDVKDKSNSLASILVLQSTWKNVGSF